jgi:hypothetical protein
MKPVTASALVLVAWLTGCTDNRIGQKCIIPIPDAAITGAELSSPATECVTRLCLIEPRTGKENPPRSTCTGQCATNADCPNEFPGLAIDGLCPSSFVCAVATVEGAFKCKPVCVCHDDLVCGVNSDADGGVITPAACPNATSPAPKC